jgi:hypothetical protein
LFRIIQVLPAPSLYVKAENLAMVERAHREPWELGGSLSWPQQLLAL